MMKSSLCDYRDACIHYKETITIPNNGTARTPNNANKKKYLKIVLHVLIAYVR